MAEAFGTPPTLDDLLNPILDQEMAIIFLDEIGREDYAAWSIFFERFVADRASGRSGPALLVADLRPELTVPGESILQSWRTGLRRGDLVIWAEEHLPTTRDGLAADLAVVLAVELCAWRLDLAASLVQARLEDLAEPVTWLSRRTELPIFGPDPPCPLAILAQDRKNEVHKRIWRAQLTTLFPEIEERRLEVVATHRSRLQLDNHLLDLGVASIDEMELGALRFQLRRYLTRTESEQLDTLVHARNALAHRRPVDPEDALQLLRRPFSSIS
ncbi:hypothetical protein [Acidiphilium sp.]|uniref:hypothetical protein n=1 Tax=Acidiphilium sp. TaxID=527 RepID=UPI00258ABA0C|nr:hypothetical protein [Acidiphilium sp.]